MLPTPGHWPEHAMTASDSEDKAPRSQGCQLQRHNLHRTRLAALNHTDPASSCWPRDLRAVGYRQSPAPHTRGPSPRQATPVPDSPWSEVLGLGRPTPALATPRNPS
ncbi:unnamed protein product [Rangifer tarandus platyrhynchus]|uniref:Uncharacterized protein n=1 Tax=Rangifer tarandus platyrhynchus TaxID=3082113 RepID=A0ABN8YQE1_RANTA|nr:unnamed protein product [Rangifer tarandus platyrhynchus]